MYPFDKPIYVLLYHPWLDGFETCFVHHLCWLKHHGFETISLEDLLRHVKGERNSIPDRPIVMTFDDGSVENYTVVYPLLKQYGFSGTVFAPTADEYIEKSGMNWWEEVEKWGVLGIEGHSHTHALIFVNDQVEGFHTGRETSKEPIIKGLDPRPGFPIFGRGYELISQRFFPDSRLIDLCVDYAGRMGKAFFEEKGWKIELMNLVAKYQEDRGRYETEHEKRRRIQKELEVSKEKIEEVIGGGKRVRFFAYPFGAYSRDLVESVKEGGYWSAFTTEPGGNRKGDNPYLLKRIMILSDDSFGGLDKVLAEYE